MGAYTRCFLLLCACLLGGCQNPEPPPACRLLRLNVPGEPATLDPRKEGDILSSTFHFLLFDGLTRACPDGSVVPAQAASIDLSEDHLTYTFHLKQGRWSDGSPVTSYDFAESWKKILSPEFHAVNAYLFYPIKQAEPAKRGRVPLEEVGISTPDAHTLVVTLEAPTPYFLKLVSFYAFYPVSRRQDAACPLWAKEGGDTFVCNGPFLLKEWKHNSHILLEKNPLYWNERQIHTDQIHFSMVRDEATALRLYEQGGLDFLGNPLSPIPVDALPKLAAQGLLHTHPVAGTTACVFNTQTFPFSNAHLRWAFALAIDRSALAAHVLQPGEEIALGPVPPLLKQGKRTSFFRDADVERARALLQQGLQELGLPASALDGIVYTHNTMATSRRVAQAMQQQWKQTLGVHVALEALEPKVLLNKLCNRGYTFAHTQWLAQYDDQMTILERFKWQHSAKNYPSWQHPEYIRLLDRSAQEPTPEARLATLEAAEAVLMADMPLTPLYHWSSSFIATPRLQGASYSPLGGLFIERLYIDP
jgi:oligopeptide transport system substrate-binding protein